MSGQGVAAEFTGCDVAHYNLAPVVQFAIYFIDIHGNTSDFIHNFKKSH